jgi:hypothetical protein
VSGSDRPSEVDAPSGKGVLVGDHGTQHNVFVEQRVASAAPVALAQLPPLANGFTGRQAELAQIAELLDPAAGSRTLVVSAVAGGSAATTWSRFPTSRPSAPSTR